MRIALTVNFSPWSAYSGGGQRSAHALASALSARGHEVTLVCTKPPWERVPVPAGLPYRLCWATLPARVTRRDALLRPLTALSVAAQLAAIRPHVVHAQGEEGALAPQAVPAPLVLTPRYPSYPRLLEEKPRGARALVSALRDAKYHVLRHAAAQATFVCPTSEASARDVARALRVESARLRVVPNGIDPTFFVHAREPAAERAGPLLFFGRLEREKGVDTLLEALSLSAHRTRRLAIVGDGRELAWLARSVRERGLTDRVDLLGWEPSPRLALRIAGAALVVLPSREESFGNAVVEAMAAGAPVVATRAGSIPELVEDGLSGLLVPPGDAKLLAQALDALLAAPERARALGEAARARARAKYAWDASAAQYEKLYDEAVARRAAALGRP